MPLAVTLFGNAAFRSMLSGEYITSIIVSADGLHYIIAVGGSSPKIFQTSLDGTITTVLFNLNTSLSTIYRSGYARPNAITYNPLKTKFIIALDDTIVETNLDGTNPIVKVNSNTKIYGTNITVFTGGSPQSLTLSYDNQYYLATMASNYSSNVGKIIQFPVTDMGNPTVFTQGSYLDARGISPEQMCYSIDGTKLLFASYGLKSIQQLNLDGTNATSPTLYTNTDLGNIYTYGAMALTVNANRTGYIACGYYSANVYNISIYSSPQPLPTYPPTVPYQPPAPPAPSVPVITNPPAFHANMSNANTNLANPSAQSANFDPSVHANQRSGATLANSVAGFYDAASKGQIRPNAPPVFSSYQQMMAWKQGMNRR